MSNGPGTTTSREEEIAFLVVEAVLGVEIRLADANGGNNTPDGIWEYQGPVAKRGVIEVTSPPDTSLMGTWARARRAGAPQSESGSVPVRWNELGEFCTLMLREPWACENVEKLTAYPADERHLFLFGRSNRVGDYFNRLSDTYDGDITEQVDDLVLPEGVTDVWFRGRARRSRESHGEEIRVARFQRSVGWQRHSVLIDEQALPSPSLSDDTAASGSRRPKRRTAN